MIMWVLDLETYFDDDYSLSKMTTEAYVRDPRFDALGMGALMFADGELKHSEFIVGKDIAPFFDDIGLADALCHHAHFDGLALNHHYGVRPARWMDTLSMANLVHGASRSKSLASLAEHYSFPAKDVPYDLFKGKHWSDLSPDVQRLVADGCLHDCELTYLIYGRMKELVPPSEMEVINLTIRMFTEPRLDGDRILLSEIRDAEWGSKQERLYALGVTKETLASNDKFAALLEAEGIEVPMKPGKLKPIPAVAKSDPFMVDLLEDSDERISGLVGARLEVRSTLNETRAGRLAAMAERGPLPVYLHYAGAHTRRWSGGDGVNFQNLPRRGRLRRAIQAPEGYLLACPDQSQGECRILNWLAGETAVIERFRNGEDPYLPIASKFYGRPITKSDVAERGTGKQLELSCGYGAGGETIVRTAAKGTYGPPVALTLAQGMQARNLYRSEHPRVVELWNEGTEVLSALAGKSRGLVWRDVLTIDNGRLVGPTGLWIDYTSLRYDAHEWRLYDRYGGYRKMYGAKLVENVVQFLSRLITSQAMRAYKAAGYQVVGMSHDDVWLLVPEPQYVCYDAYGRKTASDGSAEMLEDAARSSHKQRIIEIMSTTPSWAPGLPLAAECKIGKTYA